MGEFSSFHRNSLCSVFLLAVWFTQPKDHHKSHHYFHSISVFLASVWKIDWPRSADENLKKALMKARENSTHVSLSRRILVISRQVCTFILSSILYFSSWIINLLLDGLVCSIVRYFRWSLVCWLALRACQNRAWNMYTLFDGLAYNTSGYFASCVVFFWAPQGRVKIQAMSKMSARIMC